MAMKKMTARAFAVLMLSFVLSCAFGATAFAEDEAAVLTNGAVTSSSTTLNIPKGVTFINADSTPSYGPDITYSYTIAPATVGENATVNDGTVTASVHAGPADGAALSTASVSFSSDTAYPTSLTGVEASQNIVVKVDPTKFSAPGVYRYVITDGTTADTLYNAGIVRASSYSTTRYLDVYILRSDSSLAVNGYVLRTADLSAKSAGFNSSAEGTSIDQYRTYNILLEKSVTGTMGDTDHAFPFSATIDNKSIKYYATTDLNNFASENLSSITVSDTNPLTASLKDGEKWYIRGLSPKATVSYMETNDTGDSYTVTAQGKNADEGTFESFAITKAENAANKTYSIEAGSITTYDTTNSTSSVSSVPELSKYYHVQFANQLDAVSPTGVVLRFAPYIIMGCAGLLLLAFFALRRREKDPAEF